MRSRVLADQHVAPRLHVVRASDAPSVPIAEAIAAPRVPRWVAVLAGIGVIAIAVALCCGVVWAVRR